MDFYTMKPFFFLSVFFCSNVKDGHLFLRPNVISIATNAKPKLENLAFSLQKSEQNHFFNPHIKSVLDALCMRKMQRVSRMLFL